MRDIDIIRKLKSNGLPRTVATVLVELKNADIEKGLTAKQIQLNTGLSQPQVSKATIYAYSRGWITVTYPTTKTAGRPLGFYNLSKPFKEILKEVADARAQYIAREMDQLNALRAAV
jgi:predicted transcriptional regulator